MNFAWNERRGSDIVESDDVSEISGLLSSDDGFGRMQTSQPDSPRCEK